MEGLYCEVIGCGGRACWKLLSGPDSYREDYLCNTHWEQLRLRAPRQAMRYMHLSRLLAEGMEQSSWGDSRCVVRSLPAQTGDVPDSEASLRFPD